MDDEDGLQDRLRELAGGQWPRLFALFEFGEEGEPGRVFAWGMEFAGELGAQLCGSDGNTHGSFRSARRALDVFGRVRPLALAYLPPAHMTP